MRWITIVRRRFRSLLRRGAAERELEAELNLHLERLIAANLADGLTPGEARRQALVSFGGIEPLKEASRDVRQTGRVFDCMRDLRHGLRLLRKSPGFTAFAVLTLALGIGANIAVFTVINAAMLRPLPVPGADALVTVSQHIRGTISRDVHDDATFVSYSEYRQYAKDNRVFSGLAAYLPFVDTTLGSTEHRPVLGALTSCNYFDVLELHPARGRFFRGADCGAAGTGAVVVLSDALWRQAFDRDPQMVGKSIVLNRTRFTVIGVAAPGFAGTQPVASAFWAPVTMAHAFHPEFDYLGDNNMSWLALIGRLKPGLTRGQAGANLNVIATRFNALQAGRITTVSLGYATLASTTAMGEVMAIIGGIILAAVGLVLLMACANLAGFILARGESRRKEIAVRLALGAGRGRIIRQLFAESLLLAIFGGAAGGLAAAWSTDSLFRLALARLPIAPEFTSSLRLTPDLRTLLFAFGMALVTACAFGLAPALQASRAELATAMKEGSGQVHSAGASAGRRQRWLVGAQVAVCMILLLAAGLLLHALVNALHPRLGFETANIEAVALDLADAGYDQARGMAFDRQLQDRVAALPGVEGVAEATLIPLSGSDDETGLSLPGGGPALQVHFNSATPNFFPLLGIAILRGRNFTPVEAQTGAHVLIVSRETARRLWPNQDPIGKLARFGGSRGSLCQVVGVAADAQIAFLGQSDTPYVYRPAGPAQASQLNLLARSAGANSALTGEIAAIAQSLDPALPVTVAPLADNLKTDQALARVFSVLAGVLGTLALLLAIVGIYGMVAYTTSRRTREIGIRIALGADRGEVVGLIVRQGLFPVFWGILAGAVVSAVLARPLADAFAGVSPWDPITFIAMPLFLLATAGLASFLPARGALNADPVAALRCE